MDNGNSTLRDLGFRVWHAVISYQDAAGRVYGIWPQYLEEPFNKMNNPDWNRADTCSSRAGPTPSTSFNFGREAVDYLPEP